MVEDTSRGITKIMSREKYLKNVRMFYTNQKSI